MLWTMPLLMLVIGYLLGSIPFGLLLTRQAGLGDIRAIGSGNIGATNVLRTGNKKLAAATLLLDLAKGAAAVMLAYWLSPDDAPLAGAAAVIGHLYPVWLRFNGGKGVATLMGVVLALSPAMGGIYAAVWIGTLVLLRISSLGGMLAAASVPVAAVLLGRVDLLPLSIALALLVLWRHRENLGRLLRGQEPRIGTKKPDVDADAA
jgi:glycerol-3-phosphate acyltransferase PlsY